MSFDPQNAPDFWTHEVRRVVSVDGEELVVVRNQDGETFVVNAFDFDHPGMP